ncbi:hypothetical protein [Kosakonia phage Kc259]|nr:hypothetical protein [Kosakonia phage Kc259]
MSQRLINCPICRTAHPAGIRCDEWRDQQRKEKEAAAREPEMDYSGSNPMIALAVAEGWGGSAKFNDADLRAALHQTTGTAFMREYVKRAMGEGVISPKTHKPFDALTTRELMRLFKTAYDRYGLVSTREDAPVPVNAGPRENVVYMGRGEGEPFKMGNTTYKPEDEPQAAAPQDGTKVQGYRKLSDADIAKMNDAKAHGRALVGWIDEMTADIKASANGPAMRSAQQAAEEGQALRWLAIARTNAQQAVMAACRAIARPEDDC